MAAAKYDSYTVDMSKNYVGPKALIAVPVTPTSSRFGLFHF